MLDEEALSSLTAVIRGLATGDTPPYESPEFSLQTTNGSARANASSSIVLPGLSSVSKRSLEKGLTALQSRIRYLESKASTVNKQALPDTPNDSGGSASPFGTCDSTPLPRREDPVPIRTHSGSARQSHISSLLSGTNRNFSDEEFRYVRDHVERQSQDMRGLKDTIASVREQLHQQQEEARQNFIRAENENTREIKRELQKHQQANEAFQKALKEIGTIVTNVAKGDLSRKVQIHERELDPEITAFKITINTMMDQLQVFGSEVSRVAREVGTEGKLGGQAQITGVHGIWEELTGNGLWKTPSLCDSDTDQERM